MVQLINLGGIKNVNGKNVLNGSNSGIDTAGLVDALAKAKALPAVNMQTRITANKQKITALSQMKTLMTNLQTSLNALRNPVGLEASSNVFAKRVASISASDNSTASNYLSVTAKNGAAIDNYSVSIDQLATVEIMKSASFPDSTSSVVGDGSSVSVSRPGVAGNINQGSFDLNGVPITLTTGQNLSDIANSINAVSGQTNVVAKIVKISDGNTQLVLTGTKTGAPNHINITNDDTGFSNTSNISVTQPAQDAHVYINGDSIYRSTNSIDDVIDGVTFNLTKPTPEDVTLTVEIDKDQPTVATAIGNMLDAYNALRQFQAQQKQRDADGKLVTTAVLNNDPTMSTIIDRLSALIGSQAADAIPDTYLTNTDPVAPVKLGDLGISLGDIAATDDITNADGTITTGSPGIRNVLQIDVTKLDASLKNNFADVAKIFQFGFTSSSANLSSYKHDNTVIDSKFTISVDDTQPPGQQAKITAIDGALLATPVYLTYTLDSATNQYRIKGQAGSSFADIDINYTGNGNSTFDQSATLDSKALTISMDKTQPVGSQAKITSIYGAVLATPISLVYTASSTASGIVSGAPGSGYEGLQLLYTGDAPESVNISISQGIADISYNDLSSMLGGITGSISTSTGGLVDAAVTNLQDSDAKLQTAIDRINDQVTSYREQLLNRFSKLEAAIGSANQLLTLLSAQSDARNNQ